MTKISPLVVVVVRPLVADFHLFKSSISEAGGHREAWETKGLSVQTYSEKRIDKCTGTPVQERLTRTNMQSWMESAAVLHDFVLYVSSTLSEGRFDSVPCAFLSLDMFTVLTWFWAKIVLSFMLISNTQFVFFQAYVFKMRGESLILRDW